MKKPPGETGGSILRRIPRFRERGMLFRGRRAKPRQGAGPSPAPGGLIPRGRPSRPPPR
ncbi:hypothetical protein DM47_2528 [Burkholderia mallei]|nr:hypothetical protein DM47_2528 [Burkholderia mallei]